jgi:hypothetical protein
VNPTSEKPTATIGKAAAQTRNRISVAPMMDRIDFKKNSLKSYAYGYWSENVASS